MIKKCEYCNKEFETNRVSAKYCNWRCKDRSEGKYQKECATCGKEFKTNYSKAKYCTEDCKPTYEKICCCCGKKYTTKNVRPLSYCSLDCEVSTKPYLYKCINKEGDVIFIGSMNKLNKEMGMQYNIIENTLFGEVEEIWRHCSSGSMDRRLKELYYIRKYNPKYEDLQTYEEHKKIEDLEIHDWELIYKK